MVQLLESSFILSGLYFMFYLAWPEQYLVSVNFLCEWGNTLFSPFTNAPCILRVFHSGCFQSCGNSQPCSSSSFRWFFPQSWQFPHIRALVSKWKTCEWPSDRHQSSLSVKLPSLWYFTLQPLATLTFLNSQLCILNSRSLSWGYQALPHIPISIVD